MGGFLNDHAILHSYEKGSFVDLSSLVGRFSYVDWAGAGIQSTHQPSEIRQEGEKFSENTSNSTLF
jgi:hypothetical protein